MIIVTKIVFRTTTKTLLERHFCERGESFKGCSELETLGPTEYEVQLAS